MHAYAARNCATIIILIKIGLSVSNANNGVMKHASLLNVERMHLYAISVIIRPRRLGLVANNIEQPISLIWNNYRVNSKFCAEFSSFYLKTMITFVKTLWQE